MRNLLTKTEMCNFSKKKKEGKACFADKGLSSWTGLGRSGHVQITTLKTFSHVSVVGMAS